MRALIRYSLVLLGGFIAGSRPVEAVHSWREWHRWAVADPSAADLYRTDFWIDLTVAAVAVAVVALLHRALGPSAPPPVVPPRTTHSDRT